ncbi:MAG: hypothetical protein ACKO3N_16520 [Verrucomicrobiota bacterium]
MGSGEQAATGASVSRGRWPGRWGAWQPFTGRGVAAFAAAPVSRLLAWQILVASLAALTVVWCLQQTWVPVLDRAVAVLPEAASLGEGRLHWPDNEPRRLAGNPWLEISVRPDGEADLGQTADLHLQVRAREVRLLGLAGHVALAYPPALRLDLGRIPATAAWGAWRPAGLAGIGLLTAVGLILAWWMLAGAYLTPAWLLGLALGRSPGAAGAGKLAGAALIPGAITALASLLAYAAGMVRLPGFLMVFSLHLPVGWVWLAWGLSRLPHRTARARPNPFQSGERPPRPGGRRPNPFVS